MKCENESKKCNFSYGLCLLFIQIIVSVAGHWEAYLTHAEVVSQEGKFIEKE